MRNAPFAPQMSKHGLVPSFFVKICCSFECRNREWQEFRPFVYELGKL